MNPWLSRATEKLHFAHLALEGVVQLSADSGAGSQARRAMLEEAAALHAWGGWLATLNAIAVHLNLPARQQPDTMGLLADAETAGARAEALSEIGVLRQQPASWLNQLERRAGATWQLRARPEETVQPGRGLIARSTTAEADETTDLNALVAACNDFLERHKAVMEEW